LIGEASSNLLTATSGSLVGNYSASVNVVGAQLSASF
jgi:hypothetical protein